MDRVIVEILTCPKCHAENSGPKTKPISILCLDVEYHAGKSGLVIFSYNPFEKINGNQNALPPIAIVKDYSTKPKFFDYHVKCPNCSEFSIIKHDIPATIPVFCARNHQVKSTTIEIVKGNKVPNR